MHRMLRQLRNCRHGSDLSSDAVHVLVQACGEVLVGADAQPIEFASAQAAEQFASRFLCEPALTRRATCAPRAA